MNQRPLVSIVIPAFNSRFFRQALESALAQTYEHVEIVICDDSPDEEIRDIVQSIVEPAHPIRYSRNSQCLGLQQNLLRCVKEASGEFIKVLCDDDRLFIQSIGLQAQVLIQRTEVNLVFAQRLLSDTNDFMLPVRLENSRFCTNDSLFKGDDMLAILESVPRNFMGNFSAALMRRADVLELLPVLVQPEAGFIALLDFALFICLLRRGNMVMLNSVLSVERLGPERLGKQPGVLKARAVELVWLLKMLAARSGEAAAAHGWVRYQELRQVTDEVPRQWEELGLLRVLNNVQTAIGFKVGAGCESYAELYRDWLSCRQFSATQKRLLPQKIAGWSSRPQIVPIIVDETGDAAALELTLESLASQLYSPVAVVLISNTQRELDHAVLQLPLQGNWVEQVNAFLPQLEGVHWFYLLRSGDRLVESALLLLAERIAVSPGVRCLYSDEGTLVDGESSEPVFKPGFNLDLMRGYPYVGRTLAFERQQVINLGGFDPAQGELAPHDLLWRLVEEIGPQAIGHIAQIQLESLSSFAHWLSRADVVEGNPRLLTAHLQRIGVAHRLHHHPLPLLNRIDYQHPHRPLVSIIIQAGDQLFALQRCVESLIEKTAYSHYEILIVDGGSDDPAMAGWLAAMSQLGSDMLRVLSYSRAVDEAAIHNFAALHARGEYLLLLSARSMICSSDWLDELLNHAQRPEVGVVGAKLLNLQGAIVKAGLVLGMQGPASSPFVGESATARGYLQRLQVVQNWSAVSANCLMVRKEVFDTVGQFNEAAFTLGLSDLDLCLRVGKDGYLVVWTPYSTVVLLDTQDEPGDPHEQQVRELEQEAFYVKWLPEIARDPAYNPNLSLGVSSFSLEPGARGSWNPFCSRTLPSILGLPINTTAVGHYRVSQPFTELESAGRIVGRLAFEMPSVVELERMSPDVIVFQGRYSEGPVNQLAQIKKYSSALRIFELDDYVVSAPKKNVHARNKPANTEALLRRGIGLCDRLVVTTQPLAEALSGMHHDIRVVPNMLAQDLWSGLHSRRETSSKPRVGWGGGTSHTGDLEVIAEVVRELACEVEWVFFGMCPDQLKPYIHEFHPAVGLKDYPAKLASLNLDLALAPLEFHIFNDCKSNLRLLEYGACGYPVICTDTEAYRGYLPCTRVYSNSTQEWLEAIRMHLSDPVASYRMGDELREAVLRDFMLRDDNLQHWVWGWLAD